MSSKQEIDDRLAKLSKYYRVTMPDFTKGIRCTNCGGLRIIRVDKRNLHTMMNEIAIKFPRKQESFECADCKKTWSEIRRVM